MELSSNASMNSYTVIATTHFPRSEQHHLLAFFWNGSWEVALSEIVFPSSFNNVVEGKFDLYWPTKKIVGTRL